MDSTKTARRTTSGDKTSPKLSSKHRRQTMVTEDESDFEAAVKLTAWCDHRSAFFQQSQL